MGLGLLGCPWHRLPKEYHSFFQLPLDSQRVELARMPIPDQLDLYVVGITRLHPPDIGLALMIGEQGPRVLPVLLDRVHNEPNEYVKSRFATILVGMPCTSVAKARIVDAIRILRVDGGRSGPPLARVGREGPGRY